MRRDIEHDLAGGELERLLAERGNWLMAIALALTGERVDAEDLLQAALERVLRHRRGLDISPEAYLRRTLYNLAADNWRRRGAWRRKVPVLRTEYLRGGAGTAPDDTALVDLRDELVRLLVQLPPHQRAVILLRYWEQLTASETAEVLGCSEGAVKSATSKGLHRLRGLAGGSPGGSVTSGPGESASGEELGSAFGQAGAIEAGQEVWIAPAQVSPAGRALIRMVRNSS